MSTQIDTAAMDGVSEELIDKCPEPVGEVIGGVIAELRTAHDRIDSLEETVEQQDERIEQLEKENRILRIRADGLSKKAENLCEAVFGDKDVFDGVDPEEMTDLRQRIDDLEETAEETHPEPANPGCETVKDGSQTFQTPLEQICATPEHIADRELTANQERARFIARDVRDYAEKAPAGLVIDSRAIKRVLTASEGKRPHTQTVARVMDFLDDLGKEGVQLKKRRGRKFIVVDPEAADRLAHHDRCDGGMDGNPPEAVMETG